jgi:hypothetical protein
MWLKINAPIPLVNFWPHFSFFLSLSLSPLSRSVTITLSLSLHNWISNGVLTSTKPSVPLMLQILLTMFPIPLLAFSQIPKAFEKNKWQTIFNNVPIQLFSHEDFFSTTNSFRFVSSEWFSNTRGYTYVHTYM